MGWDLHKSQIFLVLGGKLCNHNFGAFPLPFHTDTFIPLRTHSQEVAGHDTTSQSLASREGH